MLGNTAHPVPPVHPVHPAGPFDRALVWTGAVLATLPFVATVGLALFASLTERRLLVDWLMPAELAVATFAGGVALAFVAWRTGLRRWLVGGALAAAAATLALTNGVAFWTGLADGTHAAEGGRLALVVAVYATFVLAALALATAGWLLVRDLRDAPVA